MSDERKLSFTNIIYILLIILTAIPLLSPLGLPIPIDDKTREVHDLVETLNPGDVVVLSPAITAAQWSDVGPGIIALTNHFFMKDAKVIVADFLRGDGALLMESAWDVVDIPAGKQYGVDYVNLGFFPGTETAMAAFANDVRGTTAEDVRGNPTSQLAILEGVDDMSDVDLVVVVSEQIPNGIGQFRDPYGVKFIGFPNTMGVPSTMPYYTAGSIDAILNGLSGGTEYEILINKPGRGAATLDAQTLNHLLILALIVIGNIMAITKMGA
jgi:hypothetical protein